MKKYFYKLRYLSDETEWRAKAKRRLVFESFKKYFPNPQKKIKILDYGCGSGFLQVEFEKNFPNVRAFGVDNSKEAIEFCHKRGISNVKLCKDTKIPFKNQLFDVVVAIDLLEHIKDDLKALKEIKRVLKNSGLGIFLVPSHPYLWSKRDLELKHFRRYQTGELKMKCQETGFKIIDSKNIDFALYFIFFLLHSLSKRKSGIANIGFKTAMVSGFLNNLLYFFQIAEYELLNITSYPVGLCNLIIVKK